MKDNKKLKTCFITTGKYVQEVIRIGPDTYALTQYVFRNTGPIFEEKIDAMYYNFKKAIDKGKPHTKYAASPYYKEYCNRLKVDCPELFI